MLEALINLIRQSLYDGLSPLNSDLFAFVVADLSPNNAEGTLTLKERYQYDGYGILKTKLPTSADDIELVLTDKGLLTFNIKFAGLLVGTQTRDSNGSVTSKTPAELPIDFNAGIVNSHTCEGC